MIQTESSPSNSPSDIFRRTRTTWTAYFTLGLFAYLETVVGPSMPFLRSKLDLGFTIASLHFSLFAAGMVLSGVIADRIITRIGRRKGFWIGMTGMVVGAAMFALSNHVAGSLLGVALMGFVGTWLLITNQAVLADTHPHARTVALSESNVVASAAAIMAPLAVGGFARFGPGWEMALLIAIPVLILLYWKYGSAPIPPARTKEIGQSDRTPLPGLFWVMWCVLFLSMSVEWCMAYWGADYLHEEIGLTRATASTAMSLFFIAMITGRLMGARLARRVPGSRLLMASFLLGLVGFPLFWLGSSSWVSLAGLFLTGLGVANFYPLTIGTAMGLFSGPVDRPLSRMQISGGSALLLMPLLVGIVSDAVGMKTGLGIIVPLLIAAFVAVMFVDRNTSQTVPAGTSTA